MHLRLIYILIIIWAETEVLVGITVTNTILIQLHTTSVSYFIPLFRNAEFVPCPEKGDPKWPPTPPSHLALHVMCCQPQQKSGCKQPETNTSLPLQGMLCFSKEGQRRQAWGLVTIDKLQKLLNVSKKNSKENEIGQPVVYHQRETFCGCNDLTSHLCRCVALLSSVKVHMLIWGWQQTQTCLLYMHG